MSKVQVLKNILNGLKISSTDVAVKDANGKAKTMQDAITAINNNAPVHMRMGSKVLVIPLGSNSTLLFTLAEITNMFGIGNLAAGGLSINVTNGDGNANLVHIEGTTFTPNNLSYYIVTDGASTGEVRVNYVIFYSKNIF